MSMAFAKASMPSICLSRPRELLQSELALEVLLGLARSVGDQNGDGADKAHA